MNFRSFACDFPGCLNIPDTQKNYPTLQLMLLLKDRFKRTIKSGCESIFVFKCL